MGEHVRSGWGAHAHRRDLPPAAALLMLFLAAGTLLTCCGKGTQTIERPRAAPPWTLTEVLSTDNADKEVNSFSCVAGTSCFALDGDVGYQQTLVQIDTATGKTRRLQKIPVDQAGGHEVQCTPAACLVPDETCPYDACMTQVDRFATGTGKYSFYDFPESGGVTVACDPSALCVAAGNNQADMQFAVTDDSGQSWIVHVLALPREGAVDGEACLDRRTCVVAVSQSPDSSSPVIIYRTTNGGKSWQGASVPGLVGPWNLSRPLVEQITCPTTTECIGTGFSKEVVTTNSGLSWTTLPIPGQRIIRYMSCPDAQSCVVLANVGAGAQVGWTETAGRSWTWATVANVLWQGLACQTTQDCLVAGYATNGLAGLTLWRMTRSPGQ